MARIRGISFSSRGESFRRESSVQGEARRRPTASARRRCATPIEDDPIEKAFEAPDDDDEEEHADVPNIQEDVSGFTGGPRDASLLTHYDRGDMLKLISHEEKKLESCHEGIQHTVLNTTLMSLTHISYDYVNKGLLLGFIERWLFETSSFHLPIGEMSVTLDDVSTLLHLLVMGQMWDLEELEFEDARTTLVDLLGADGDSARVRWRRYARGVAALAHLYEQLTDASLASTRKMTGYLTLLQSLRYEHFLGMGRRQLMSSYDDSTPRATRWQSPRKSSTLAEIRSQLDALTYSRVLWHPY
ncbi:protein MAIN-LIKE 1-like [Vigna umbellata]|uniref:protein MAIN-LIKE 1-like n=1 Tax=Vigna umbellata TaxID=87088 RepID=UPI001F5E40B9|nr:protein MAIN-LIKE 1-like [Vigna umbellata]